MHRALAMLLAALALLAALGVAAPAVASPTLASSARIPNRLDLAENCIYGNFHSGTAEAEGHSLFLQRDPAGYTDSVNLYAAFANDPVNNRDPTGRWVNIAAGAVIGGLAGGALDLVRQAAELADAGKEISWANLDGKRAALAALKGTVAGAAVGACPVCGVGLSVAGTGIGAYSATTEIMAGNYRTAAVDGAGAVLSAFGGVKLQKGIASGKVAKIDPSLSKAASKLTRRGSPASPSETPTRGPPAAKPVGADVLRGSSEPLEINEGGALLMAEMRRSGLIDLAVTTKGTNVSGRSLFQGMMTHFGSKARGIRGNFIDENLATVNELTSQGMPLSRAINYTWTARMAAEYGFMRVRLLGAEGEAGSYTRVSAVFY